MDFLSLRDGSYSFFKVFGALVVGVQALKISSFLLLRLYYRIQEICGLNFKWEGIEKKWAVVTGGTDGIGKAYAEELAGKGFNICLISRNIDKLNSAAKEIEQTYKVSTQTVNVDFTGGPEIYSEIEGYLKDLDGGIGVLVNNVGMSYKHAEYFHLVPDGQKVMMDLIYSNVASCTMMMKLVMPMMQHKGVIINVSSLTAVYPMPLLATYAACKVYVDYLTRAIQYEYKGKGITVQLVLPGYVATKMSNRRTSIEIPSSKTYVCSAIKTVGKEQCTYGYFPHKIRGFIHAWLKSNMPAWVNFGIAMYFMRKAREGYYRKMQKKKMEAVE